MPLPPPRGADAPFLPRDTFAHDVILVTGGGTGLGKAIATGFARLGGTVAIASRDEAHRASGIAAIEAVGGKAIGVAIDVRSAESVKTAFDEVESRLGPVTILVNNAAANFPVPSEELSPNGWRAITQITLDGPYFCSTEFARRRIALGAPGAILNIGATYAWTGGPGAAPSAAAKAGVANLVQSLSVEWAPDGIRVNGLMPGNFPHDDQPQNLKDLPGRSDMADRIPAQRVGELHELAWAACFLCSPFASYITGHNLVIDGANWLRRGLRFPIFEPVRDWARSKKS
ncbi:NAD(P)-dependent dehydrogenase (short-subunit alcohol dehydrogenase family) [Sphingobium wenxiniae]|uniref:Peroxisomal trans-2-enoyl-CoA reductase n=1 Tax=Sphingobium wenxiniae (strain DSM 21828 / CGMCC 1.7748 / JZ-1) TaxID=595605 RepID=A0A562KAT4_SPHWJ|nr:MULTISPECIES: SDR family oxidoreductase [Sphingobium]MBB6192164.1 NAD(P)-dependent dehydrogenase (short-subunit alcohol dehydrogenase family) [Sphingobium wenxiniae]TWH92540.1 NAD(P)-dependent dehydrogenase (short-subunit alcohol dehydrogenase family) [Sphingobium wenxiniae]WRD75911.1 SDR family oxidoreductase [Sphingobium baderi]